MVNNTVNFFIGLGIFVVMIVVAAIESVQSASQKLIPLEERSGQESVHNVKGDLGDLIPFPSSQEESSKVLKPPKWDDERLTTSLPSHKNKGDLGMLDPRGSVRYNILSNGRIGRGVITSLANDEAEIQQAQDSCCQSNTYAPIL